jgi:hypothetical protein
MKREEIIGEFDRLILKAHKLTEDLELAMKGGRNVSIAERFEVMISAMHLLQYVQADVHYALLERLVLAPSAREPVAVPPDVFLGVLQSAKAQLTAGLFQHARVLATADAMNDVLEQAKELLDNDYKDGACVLIGGALETTFSKMLEQDGYEGDLSRVKLKQKNDMLLKRDKYDKVTHGQVVAFADLRNDAAHGNYTAVRKEQVADFLKFARDFIMRWYTPKLT